MVDEPDRISRALQILSKDSGLEPVFFQDLASVTDPIVWLEALRTKGYFEASKNPSPIEDPKRPGNFRCPYWPVLSYLQNLAKKNLENPDISVTAFLLEFICGVMSYRRTPEHNAENWLVCF